MKHVGTFETVLFYFKKLRSQGQRSNAAQRYPLRVQ